MILNKPIITEKTLADQAIGRYTFYVDIHANKNQIALAFEKIFGVKPLTVNTYKLKGKMKTDPRKRLPIKKSDRKKAIIAIAKDKKIDILTLKTK